MSEKKPQKVSTTLGDQELILESGKLAEMAHGSVMATYGDTVVLATVVVSEEEREGVDFFPMLVDYEEKLYAAGKISGSRFIKREGRPSDQAVLTCRSIDRPLRPLFPKDFRRDIQIIVTVLSYDPLYDPDLISIIAASAALLKTDAPFSGPIAAVRVAMANEHFVLNPTNQAREQSPLDMIVAGTADKVMMVEVSAKEVPSEKVIEAIKFAHSQLKPALAIQKELVKDEAKAKAKSEESPVVQEVAKFLGKKLTAVVRETDRTKRDQQISDFEKEVIANFEGDYKQVDLKIAFQDILEKEVRQAILKDRVRPDGRKLDEIRPIGIEIGLLPRTHGSALFTRGQTQVLSIVTLGGPGEEQVIETMEEEATKRYMHHYNFPPFSTGEVKPLRSVSRREIGHGALAERALLPVIPARETFTYTIRVASEILSSNGSTSMASVCGSSLALMDAGVPIKTHVAGISIGLVTDLKDPKKFELLTDLQGIEDFAGDMDFKVSATKNGVTAIQLDTKLEGLPLEIIQQGLEKAQLAIKEILAKMNNVIDQPRPTLSKYAPRIITLKINPEKIGEVIGPQGKTIHKIIAEAGGKEITDIDIEEDGTVIVSSTDATMGEKAISLIKNLTREVKVGEVFSGTVTQIMRDRLSGKEIGAIVQILPNQDGMVHISQVANYRVNKVSDLLKVGDVIPVKVLEIDRDRNRISLSYKDALNK